MSFGAKVTAYFDLIRQSKILSLAKFWSSDIYPSEYFLRIQFRQSLRNKKHTNYNDHGVMILQFLKLGIDAIGIFNCVNNILST